LVLPLPSTLHTPGHPQWARKRGPDRRACPVRAEAGRGGGGRRSRQCVDKGIVVRRCAGWGGYGAHELEQMHTCQAGGGRGSWCGPRASGRAIVALACPLVRRMGSRCIASRERVSSTSQPSLPFFSLLPLCSFKPPHHGRPRLPCRPTTPAHAGRPAGGVSSQDESGLWCSLSLSFLLQPLSTSLSLSSFLHRPPLTSRPSWARRRRRRRQQHQPHLPPMSHSGLRWWPWRAAASGGGVAAKA